MKLNNYIGRTSKRRIETYPTPYTEPSGNKIPHSFCVSRNSFENGYVVDGVLEAEVDALEDVEAKERGQRCRGCGLSLSSVAIAACACC